MVPAYLFIILVSLYLCCGLNTEDDSSSFSEEAEKQRRTVEEQINRLIKTTEVSNNIRTTINPKGWSPHISATWDPKTKSHDDGRKKKPTPISKWTKRKYGQQDYQDIDYENLKK